MSTVLLPPGVNPVAVNKYIISYIISYHIIKCSSHLMQTDTAAQFSSSCLPSTLMKIHLAVTEMLHAYRRTHRFQYAAIRASIFREEYVIHVEAGFATETPIKLYHTTRRHISDKIDLHGHCFSSGTLQINWIYEDLEGEINCLSG
jgi:hypothetical protein